MNYDNALFTGTINSGETREERHDEVENDTVGQLRTPKTVLFACKTEKWASQEVGISLSRVYFDPDMGGCMGVPNVKKPSPGTGN
ncbi:hypothetical protein BBF93_13210 [Hyphomonas sp. CACIAM 19H1]|uniref:hypothetical protein n=1 Tax=Hyphomonas sp. CACIAM 19H1 TaxID=1873716 RepID=UPI000DED7356|nr:hypothetical protein [Hyphomonas sp. CACIAM 19H1]AXE65072.1 hypothetical protein BBF93_13210 [Hyphomonas sp. CACIAM 19H1]